MLVTRARYCHDVPWHSLAHFPELCLLMGMAAYVLTFFSLPFALLSFFPPIFPIGTEQGVEFNTLAREWRCKWAAGESKDTATLKTLQDLIVARLPAIKVCASPTIIISLSCLSPLLLHQDCLVSFLRLPRLPISLYLYLSPAHPPSLSADRL